MIVVAARAAAQESPAVNGIAEKSGRAAREPVLGRILGRNGLRRFTGQYHFAPS
jgi:hypothetical protein